MASNSIELTLNNQTNDLNFSQIVIFQWNTAVKTDESPIAWRVIDNFEFGSTYSFDYPLDVTMAIEDSYGIVVCRGLPVKPGELLQADGGVKVVGSAPGQETQIRNGLPSGTITANLYRGNLLATAPKLEPGQVAGFLFNSTIVIGIPVAPVTQGEPFAPRILDNVNNQLSLEGITQASIVMMGGGREPYTFLLNAG